jgi:hypothetical protein
MYSKHIQDFGGIWWTSFRAKDGSSITDSSVQWCLELRGAKYDLQIA